MESPDRNAAFDSVVVFAPVLLILATCLTVFHRLRARWPVKVNCWFCNENTRIRRQHLDWWLCPWCEQHNGFTKSGNYAYDIPDQYATSNVRTRYCRLSEESDSCRDLLKGKLCRCCNKRESLKLSELSNFEPKSERLFERELKAFKEYLEARYPLCDSCKLTVRDVLRRQAVWLTRYKMLFFRQKPIKMLVGSARKSETAFRVVSTILVSMVMYNHDFIWLPIGGLFSHLCACWASSMKNKSSDVSLILLWFCIAVLVFFNSSAAHQNIWFTTTEYIKQYRVIAVCAFITTLASLRSNMYKNTLIRSAAFKKIKLSRDAALSRFMYNGESGNTIVPSETDDGIESSVYAADGSSSTEVKFSRSHSAILRQKLSTITANGINNGYVNSVSQTENGLSDGCCLNDSLSTLLLSEEPPRWGRSAKAAPAIFERRVYSPTSSGNLFKRSGGAYGKRRCILSPPRLRSVTQTSWVAGGYWHEGTTTATPPTLSRSSSQSSGFGSVGSSNLAPSREPSVHDFDRCSVVSEARWSCQIPRLGAVARHDSPTPPRPQSRYSDVTGGRSRAAPPPAIRATRSNADDHRIQESCARGPSDGDWNGAAYAGRHTTVVASPGWLSALLCGSLILNMIVLCTTLLR